MIVSLVYFSVKDLLQRHYSLLSTMVRQRGHTTVMGDPASKGGTGACIMYLGAIANLFGNDSEHAWSE